MINIHVRVICSSMGHCKKSILVSIDRSVLQSASSYRFCLTCWKFGYVCAFFTQIAGQIDLKQHDYYDKVRVLNLRGHIKVSLVGHAPRLQLKVPPKLTL